MKLNTTTLHCTGKCSGTCVLVSTIRFLTVLCPVWIKVIVFRATNSSVLHAVLYCLLCCVSVYLFFAGNFASVLTMIQDLQIGAPILFSLKFLLAVPVTYHFWNGFRWRLISIMASFIQLSLFIPGTWHGTWVTVSRLLICTSPGGLSAPSPSLQLSESLLCN